MNRMNADESSTSRPFQIPALGLDAVCDHSHLVLAQPPAPTQAWKADFIITRNLPDDQKSPVPAISPAAFLKTQ
ncbi:MAG: hypothetical protein ACRDBP_13565 [Luteolibacter sp.]